MYDHPSCQVVLCRAMIIKTVHGIGLKTYTLSVESIEDIPFLWTPHLNKKSEMDTGEKTVRSAHSWW